MASNAPIRKCAVYTRKSSEEGLRQEFNSLDAQREAGVSYVRSQAGEGWKLVPTHYDDGGISGGTLERPGLQRLMADIVAGKIQIVVVYKVDRLTRSLGDFAKLVEVFEGHDVSFVSVTQQFNTTTSMGRLMLNVLLSFAQFEREVTGERIRDKIAASKKEGMWMGGVPPMGYEVEDRKLLVVERDAEIVRHIYCRYLDLGCITLLARELARDGHRTRRYESAAGKITGERPFSRGHLHRILRNRMYLGEIVHGGECYPGEHEAIVDRGLWLKVEAKLAENRNGQRGPAGGDVIALLRGRVFDDAGNPMIPVQGNKGTRRYRYYVSRAVHEGRRDEAGSVPRIPAGPFEAAVLGVVQNTLRDGPRGTDWKRELLKATEPDRDGLLARTIRQVMVGSEELRIEVLTSASPNDFAGEAEDDAASAVDQTFETIRTPFRVERRGGSIRILTAGDDGRPPARDPSLIKAVVRGHEWSRKMLGGEVSSLSDIAREAGVTTQYVRRLIRYAFLAPDITEAILSGKQPTGLTVESLKNPIPIAWPDQRRHFGMVA